MTESIVLQNDVSNLIERYDYEKRVNTAIVAFMVNNGYDVHSSEFKKRHDELVESFVRYDTAVKIISDTVSEIGGKNWTLSYKEGMLTYEK